MFVWGKNDLNPEQEKAIYNENSILLIACPGVENKNNNV